MKTRSANKSAPNKFVRIVLAVSILAVFACVLPYREALPSPLKAAQLAKRDFCASIDERFPVLFPGGLRRNVELFFIVDREFPYKTTINNVNKYINRLISRDYVKNRFEFFDKIENHSNWEEFAHEYILQDGSEKISKLLIVIENEVKKSKRFSLGAISEKVVAGNSREIERIDNLVIGVQDKEISFAIIHVDDYQNDEYLPTFLSNLISYLFIGAVLNGVEPFGSKLKKFDFPIGYFSHLNHRVKGFLYVLHLKSYDPEEWMNLLGKYSEAGVDYRDVSRLFEEECESVGSEVK